MVISSLERAVEGSETYHTSPLPVCEISREDIRSTSSLLDKKNLYSVVDKVESYLHTHDVPDPEHDLKISLQSIKDFIEKKYFPAWIDKDVTFGGLKHIDPNIYELLLTKMTPYIKKYGIKL